MSFGVTFTGIQSFTSSVTLGNSFNFLKSVSSSLKNGNKNTWFAELLQGLKLNHVSKVPVPAPGT